MAKTQCDVEGCEETAVQKFETADGPPVERCETHAVPPNDVPLGWTPTK